VYLGLPRKLFDNKVQQRKFPYYVPYITSIENPDALPPRCGACGCPRRFNLINLLIGPRRRLEVAYPRKSNGSRLKRMAKIWWLSLAICCAFNQQINSNQPPQGSNPRVNWWKTRVTGTFLFTPVQTWIDLAATTVDGEHPKLYSDILRRIFGWTGYAKLDWKNQVSVGSGYFELFGLIYGKFKQ